MKILITEKQLDRLSRAVLKEQKYENDKKRKIMESRGKRRRMNESRNRKPSLNSLKRRRSNKN